MQPHNADPNKVLSYQTAEDSAHIDCSPSYSFQFGAPQGTMMTQLDLRFMVPALAQGIYVISADYEGSKLAFGAGLQMGHAVLDGVRSVLQSKDVTGINKDAKVALWGYSGGGLATGWAVSLQPLYAPELKSTLVGCAFGGLVVNITATAELTDGTLFAGLIPLALTGLGKEYIEFQKRIQTNIDFDHHNNFEVGLRDCLVPGLLEFRWKQFFSGGNRTFTKGFALLEDPIINKTIQDNCLINLNKTNMPEIPIFMYHSKFDQVAPFNGALALYNKWCLWGIESFEFALDIFNEHLSEQALGAAAAWTWIQARLNNDDHLPLPPPPVQGCVRKLHFNNIMYPNISSSLKDYFLGFDYTVLDTLTGKTKWSI